jgi:hypothetical protein
LYFTIFFIWREIRDKGRTEEGKKGGRDKVRRGGKQE